MPTLEQIIDIDQLRRTTCRDRDLLSELIVIFECAMPRFEEELGIGIAGQDAALIARTAHKMKGSLLALGARCAQLAEQLELHAKQGFGVEVRDASLELTAQVRLVALVLHSLEKDGDL